MPITLNSSEQSPSRLLKIYLFTLTYNPLSPLPTSGCCFLSPLCSTEKFVLKITFAVCCYQISATLSFPEAQLFHFHSHPVPIINIFYRRERDSSLGDQQPSWILVLSVTICPVNLPTSCNMYRQRHTCTHALLTHHTPSHISHKYKPCTTLHTWHTPLYIPQHTTHTYIYMHTRCYIIISLTHTYITHYTYHTPSHTSHITHTTLRTLHTHVRTFYDVLQCSLESLSCLTYTTISGTILDT